MAKVFLGGTCNNSRWRESVIPKLKIAFFNPVVAQWDEAAYQRELFERENCDFCLYVITPKMTGVYSIAEVVDDSNKRPEKTLFAFIENDGEDKFTSDQLKSLKAVGKMVEINGGRWFKNLDELITFLNIVK